MASTYIDNQEISIGQSEIEMRNCIAHVHNVSIELHY